MEVGDPDGDPEPVEGEAEQPDGTQQPPDPPDPAVLRELAERAAGTDHGLPPGWQWWLHSSGAEPCLVFGRIGFTASETAVVDLQLMIRHSGSVSVEVRFHRSTSSRVVVAAHDF